MSNAWVRADTTPVVDSLNVPSLSCHKRLISVPFSVQNALLSFKIHLNSINLTPHLPSKMDLAVAILLVLLNLASWCTCSDSRLLVKMTLVPSASRIGGFCLDGSLPAYHLHRGFGAGARNWLLQFEGGGWCNDIQSCLERAQTRRGSTLYMNKLEDFNGILSNNASLNPDFYNWNRVKLRYCDGGSFSGDAKFDNGDRKSVV